MILSKTNDNTRITDNFRLIELYRSVEAEKLGIGNKIPTQEILDNLENICIKILEPLRKKIGFPIMITSGYRGELLNSRIGGSKNSQHMKGEAVDFICQNNRRAFEIIKESFVFDQLIWEKGDEKQPKWVHVSLKKESEKNRKQIIYI